jgi:hypothetical protein
LSTAYSKTLGIELAEAGQNTVSFLILVSFMVPKNGGVRFFEAPSLNLVRRHS